MGIAWAKEFDTGYFRGSINNVLMSKCSMAWLFPAPSKPVVIAWMKGFGSKE